MSSLNMLLMILAALLAMGLAWFKYFFKSNRTKIIPWLAMLRFISFFTLFVLLINPKLEREDYFVEKSNLVMLLDNSASVKHLGGAEVALQLREGFVTDGALQERFRISKHIFGNGLSRSDSLNFDAQFTNISKSIKAADEIYGKDKSTFLLISDGNQNLGADYEFLRMQRENDIYPIVVGDTITYEDLYISTVNVNKYTFLNNDFPFEVNINYNGKNSIRTRLEVLMDGKSVFQEALALQSDAGNKTIIGHIKAKSVGLKSLRFKLAPIASEKNKANNIKELAIEVIDEQTRIALVSSIMHPDLGTLKKSIEKNEQRAVEIIKPGFNNLDDYDFYILYQPNTEFEPVFDLIEKKNAGTFIVTGTQTDWVFLNSVQPYFIKEAFGQNDEVLPISHKGYGIFDLDDFNPDDFPPLKTQLGELTTNTSVDVLLWQQIRGVNLNKPLAFTLNDNNRRLGLFLGEDIWKWRMQDYRENQSFDAFDNFIEKIVRYLSDAKPKNRLEINYEPVFSDPASAKITATYFDEAYNFEEEASLTLHVKGENTFEIPMVLRDKFFEADLSSLEPGNYQFTITVKKDNISRSGQFKILNSNLEEQLVSANHLKLYRFGQNNNGVLFYPSNVGELKQKLLNDDRYTPTQKSLKSIVSLIEFKWLLLVLAISLTLEWFIRKYNGLI